MPYTHDKMRPLVSGNSTWKKIMDNLSYMVSTEEKFNVTLRTNFNTDVAESLVEFYEYISTNLNDKRINIYYETIKNQGNENTPEILSGIEELVFDVDIAQLIKKNNLICTNSTTRLLPCSRVCYASRPNYFIFDEKSQILKCSYALDSTDNVIGVLNRDGTFSFNETNYLRWVYKDYLSSEKCQQCKALPLCFGKRCPKSVIETGEMHCNIEMIQAEIEGLLDSYY